MLFSSLCLNAPVDFEVDIPSQSSRYWVSSAAACPGEHGQTTRALRLAMIAARVRPQVLILVDKKSFHWKLNPVTPQPQTHVPYENYSVSTATTVLLQGIIVSPGITIVDLYWYYSIIMLYYSWVIVINFVLISYTYHIEILDKSIWSYSNLAFSIRYIHKIYNLFTY